MRLRVKGYFLVAVILSFLAGCAGTPVTESGGISDASVDKSKVSHVFANPAVGEFWAKAEEARQLGDYETAVFNLERALRIEPQDAVVWSRMAEIRLDQGNANQAENLAAKSNAMSADNPVLNYRNWLIISKARRLQGDDIGAQEAEYTANTFVR